MVFAVYADMGAGLAFLLLLALSGLGLAVLFTVVRRAVWHRRLWLCAVAAGLLQAGAVYVWARRSRSEVSRSTLEWVWLVSLSLVVVSLAAGVLALWREGRG